MGIVFSGRSQAPTEGILDRLHGSLFLVLNYLTHLTIPDTRGHRDPRSHSTELLLMVPMTLSRQ
jgi:hypothetical protein